MATLLGADDAVVAVPEPARAFVLAALADLGSSPVVLVATPTSSEAEHLAHDLAAYAGSGRVDLLPAWETLPFERVSPSVETMGRRLRTMWHLHQAAGGGMSPSAAGAVDVQSSRSWSPRSRRCCRGSVRRSMRRRRSSCGRETSSTPRSCSRGWSHAGYRREYQVEHRGEVAVRGGIIDVFPSTMETGIRIDLFGDEVERLTEFDVGDQRSVRDIGEIEIYGCRELLLGDELAARAANLVSEVPYGRAQFERIAEGLTFDGMESWLPWLVADDRLFTDLLGAEARVVLVDPRRIRDRASELGDEEAALAAGPGDDLGRRAGGRRAPPAPSLRAPSRALPARAVASMPALAEGPDVAAVVAAGWPPVMGDPTALLRRLSELSGSGYRIAVCADGEGSAARLGFGARRGGARALRRRSPCARARRRSSARAARRGAGT